MVDEQPPIERQLLLQKIYIKDLSFESPKTPDIFAAHANAENLLNVRSANRAIGTDHYEVTLTLTVKSNVPGDTAYQVELVQAGVFTLKGYTPEERFALLGSYCPEMLYAYARETVADVANKGGFAQLLLQPLDFDAMYAQNMNERAAHAAQQAFAAQTSGPASSDGEMR